MSPLKAPFSINQNWFKFKPITYKNVIYIQRLIYTFTSTHTITFYWVALCLLLLVCRSCYPSITLHSVLFFFCFFFTLFSIKIAHVWMMLLHVWQLQWLVDWAPKLNPCLITYMLLSSDALLAFSFFWKVFHKIFFCWTISNETLSVKF